MKSLDIFDRFIQERELMNDWKVFLSRDMRMLSRTKILKCCDIKRSALYQNHQIVDRLRNLESELAASGVLRTDSAFLDREQQAAALIKLCSAIESAENNTTQLAAVIHNAQAEILKYSLPGAT